MIYRPVCFDYKHFCFTSIFLALSPSVCYVCHWTCFCLQFNLYGAVWQVHIIRNEWNKQETRIETVKGRYWMNRNGNSNISKMPIIVCANQQHLENEVNIKNAGRPKEQNNKFLRKTSTRSQNMFVLMWESPLMSSMFIGLISLAKMEYTHGLCGTSIYFRLIAVFKRRNFLLLLSITILTHIAIDDDEAYKATIPVQSSCKWVEYSRAHAHSSREGSEKYYSLMMNSFIVSNIIIFVVWSVSNFVFFRQYLYVQRNTTEFECIIDQTWSPKCIYSSMFVCLHLRSFWTRFVENCLYIRWTHTHTPRVHIAQWSSRQHFNQSEWIEIW